MADRACWEPAASALPARSYVLLVSGTFNPPHRGHVRLALHAREQLLARGHDVRALIFSPVHDNYLYNKLLRARSGGAEAGACFPMAQRCAILNALVASERRHAAASGASTAALDTCAVSDYEHAHGSELLTESSYWAAKLPTGYARTVPTVALLRHFAAHSPLLTHPGARLGAVFGVDNLGPMATWVGVGELVAATDLVFVGRCAAAVEFSADPIALLAALAHAEIASPLALSFGGRPLLTEARPAASNRHATSDGAMIVLPPLDGGDEELSSTRVRACLEDSSLASPSVLDVLVRHGLADAEALLRDPAGRASLEAMGDAARARGEHASPCEAHAT